MTLPPFSDNSNAAHTFRNEYQFARLQYVMPSTLRGKRAKPLSSPSQIIPLVTICVHQRSSPFLSVVRFFLRDAEPCRCQCADAHRPETRPGKADQAPIPPAQPRRNGPTTQRTPSRLQFAIACVHAPPLRCPHASQGNNVTRPQRTGGAAMLLRARDHRALRSHTRGWGRSRQTTAPRFGAWLCAIAVVAALAIALHALYY